MTRITAIAPQDMTDEQRAVYEDVKGVGGYLGGPYIALLLNPTFMRISQDMGNYLRACPLSDRERQIVILVVVRHWAAKYPWAVQVQRSRAVGIDQSTIDAIDSGLTPLLRGKREEFAYRVANELLAKRTLDNGTYVGALEAFGARQLVDVVATIGFFTLMSVTSNAFDIDPPGNAAAGRPLGS